MTDLRQRGADAGRAATAVLFTVLLAAAVGIYLYVRSRAAERPPAPPPSVEDPAAAALRQQRMIALQEEIRRLTEEGRASAAARAFDAALEKFGEAERRLQDIPPGPDRDARLTALREETARAARERDEARRREREAHFARRQAEFRALADDSGDARVSAWERAVALGEDLRKDFPEQDGKLQPALDSLRGRLAVADQSIRDRLREAAAAAAAGRFGAAFEQLRGARSWRADDPRIAETSGVVRKAIAALDLVRIPAGPFTAGSDDPADRNAPRRAAETGEYQIDRFEVTHEQYRWFCEDTGHPPPPHWRKGEYPPDRAAHPVTHVSAADAEAYAAWLGKRLPTEAEWEKAARGFDGRVWPWGNEFPKVPVCNGAPADPSQGPAPDTVPVGSIPGGESPYGVADMAGNVWEWTSGTGPIEDPAIAAPPGAGDGAPAAAPVQGRVLRGGSFACSRDGLRSARRYVEHPGVRLRDAGFRCVRD